jgi:hypothetical protein
MGIDPSGVPYIIARFEISRNIFDQVLQYDIVIFNLLVRFKLDMFIGIDQHGWANNNPAFFLNLTLYRICHGLAQIHHAPREGPHSLFGFLVPLYQKNPFPLKTDGSDSHTRDLRVKPVTHVRS